ncbi:MAG: GNAT family N-acetyltransferase [Bacteroidia bacterium]|nr:GNAT family N-acetyltransferase [Bacteroidia bacterium]
MNISIRLATETELSRVHQMILDFAKFIKKPEMVYITPEQMVKDKDIFKCLIAVEGKEIVGFATYFFAYYSWSGKAVYLDDLYVEEKYRGKGIGTLLFDRVMEVGKEANCFKMKWQVSSWNAKAQEFYRAKGAIIDDAEINCDLKLT